MVSTSAPGKTLGYLVPEFPSQTHVFFWREVQALRAAGARVVLFSTTKPPENNCRHEFATAATSETTYLFPAGLRDLVYLLGRPGGALAAIRYVMGLNESTLRQRLVLLGLIASSARLCRVSRGEGVSHVHIHSCANAAHIGAMAHAIDGLAYSLTLHGDLPVYGVDHLSKMRNAVFVTCVTRPLQDQVVRNAGVPRGKAPVLTMGVDTARFVRQADRGELPGALRAITVARLSRLKGHDFSLRALKALKDSGTDFHYKIVGEGDYRRAIEADVRALGLQQQVEFLGTMSESAVATALAQSDVLLLTSIGLGEAAPVAVMEAMASGIPVIASIIGGTPDMISDGVDGYLVPQEDVDAIAARLRRLAADKTLRERIGHAARARAERDFDSRVLANRLLALINAT
jgi:colanic acid/amylovoran biosynthesis glycosyltransferase